MYAFAEVNRISPFDARINLEAMGAQETKVLFCDLQVLMSASLLGALCLFSSVCVVCAISAFTLPIETKGRALQVSDAGVS